MDNRNQSSYQHTTQIYTKLFPGSLFNQNQNNTYAPFASLDDQDWDNLIAFGGNHGIAENLKFLRDYLKKLLGNAGYSYPKLYEDYSQIFSEEEKASLENFFQKNEEKEIKLMMLSIAKKHATHALEVLKKIPGEIKTIETFVEKIFGNKIGDVANEDTWRVIIKFAENTGINENFKFLRDYLKMLKGEGVSRVDIYNNYIKLGSETQLNIEDDPSLKILREDAGQNLNANADVMGQIVGPVTQLITENMTRRFIGHALEEALTKASKELDAESPSNTKTRTKTQSKKK